MKKILSVLVVVLIIAGTLTACGEKEAYDLYTAMDDAIGDISSMAGKMDAQITMDAAGENVDMRMIMDIKEIIHSETDVEMSMLTSVDMGSLGAMDMTVYFKDGWMYQEVMGMKVKMELPLEEAQKLVNTDIMSSISFGKDAVSDSKVEDVNGNKRISFTLSGDKLNDIMEELAGSALSSLMGDTEMNMTFGDVSYAILLDSGNLPLEQRIIFSMEMEVEGETVKANYDMNMTDIVYNGVDSIDYPSDLGDYMEIAM